MNISDEAVEAAANIIAQESLVNAAMDGYGWDAENDSHEPFMPRAREQARRYLEAAAPYIAAEAWDEGQYAIWGYLDNKRQGRDRPANPYRSQA